MGNWIWKNVLNVINCIGDIFEYITYSNTDLVQSRNRVTCDRIHNFWIEPKERPIASSPPITWNFSIFKSCRIKPKGSTIYGPYIRKWIQAVNNIGIFRFWWNSCWWWIIRGAVLSILSHIILLLYKFFCTYHMMEYTLWFLFLYNYNMDF